MAAQIDGHTVHHWSGIPARNDDGNATGDKHKLSMKCKALRVIVIDEVPWVEEGGKEGERGALLVFGGSRGVLVSVGFFRRPRSRNSVAVLVAAHVPRCSSSERTLPFSGEADPRSCFFPPENLG